MAILETLILASNNKGKIRELSEMLEPLGIKVISQKEAGITGEADETGTTFAENSEIKAKYVYNKTHSATLADDSGLCVDALDGQPGVYSHRFAGENATDEDRCNFLLEKLKNVPDEQRTARFVCDMCFISKDGEIIHVEGTCEGKIGYVPKGSNGFGYDPVFVYGDRTLAQMGDAEKNEISHRARALEKMKQKLKDAAEN